MQWNCLSNTDKQVWPEFKENLKGGKVLYAWRVELTQARNVLHLMKHLTKCKKCVINIMFCTTENTHPCMENVVTHNVVACTFKIQLHVSIFPVHSSHRCLWGDSQRTPMSTLPPETIIQTLLLHAKRSFPWTRQTAAARPIALHSHFRYLIAHFHGFTMPLSSKRMISSTKSRITLLPYVHHFILKSLINNHDVYSYFWLM
jgi:hypothetical protein